MKIKWSTNQAINVSVVSCIIIMAVLYLFSTKNSDRVFHSEFDTPMENIASIDGVIPDSVTYRRHLEMRDSIKTMRYLKNGDIFNVEAVKFSNLIGAGRAMYCDTCSLKWYREHCGTDLRHQQYYLDLNGWGLNDSEYAYASNNYVEFYVKHGQSYIRKHDTETPVKFRYDHENKCIRIPLAKLKVEFIGFGILAFSILFLLYYLFLIVCFLKLLVDISKGLVFTVANLRRLLTISISLLAFPMALYLANLLLKLIFHNYFTPDVIMNENVWKDSWKCIAWGIVFLLLYKAFRQGKALKDEQDLTV